MEVFLILLISRRNEWSVTRRPSKALQASFRSVIECFSKVGGSRKDKTSQSPSL